MSLNLASAITSGYGSRNYDYEEKYQRDKQGDEATENARVWNVYLDEAESYDMDMIEGFRNNIDGLLVFAALFSAVVTTFVAQTSQSLQPDNAQITASLLYENNQILRAAGNKTTIDAVPRTALVPGSRTYSSTDLWVNGLFFTSLALSLSTALLTVLAKQWIQVCMLFTIMATTFNRDKQAYTVAVSGSARTRALIRHFRFEGLMKWRLSDVVESLPLILHSSVAIFFIGLALYVSKLSRPICGVVSAITALTFVFYLGTSMLPMHDIACPYCIPFIFSLAKPLVSAFFVAGLLYFKLQNIFFTWIKDHEMWNFGFYYDRYCPKWSEVSLKTAEQKQVLLINNSPFNDAIAHHACNALDWVFDHASNRSVKNIVVEALCALLEEWNLKANLEQLIYIRTVVLHKYSNLFLSAATYSLLQWSDTLAQSATEQDLEQSTCGRLIRNLMKIFFSETLFDEGITTLKNWQEEIEPLWIEAYKNATRSRQHTLSWCLLDWGQPMLQKYNLSILFTCAAFGNAKDIHNLVERGMNLNLCDKSKPGWTALHEAAWYGNLDTVTALSQREPGLMSQASDYLSQKPRTALEVAIQYCEPGVVAYLLDHSAQAPPNALHDAVRLRLLSPPADKCLGTVQLLLDRGWDRTTKDESGKMPIDYVHDWPNWYNLKPTIVECLENYPTNRPSQSEPTALPTSNEEENKAGNLLAEIHWFLWYL
ncbi:hypothetical protein C0993_003443 [Termitomyces sp. T159_Od127]|nr:hypothetical protein C0993_003443 [Termitomyces sp. T159_Od127]